MPTEEQRATCRTCGHAIIWYFDRDMEAELLEHGFWYDAETMIESCMGLDGEGAADDADMWHEPDETA